MSTTITRFHGISPLPTKPLQRTGNPNDLDEHELSQEIGIRYGDEVSARPHVIGLGFPAFVNDNEYGALILIDTPIDKLSPDELRELEKSVGEYKAVLEYSEMPSGDNL